MSKLRLVPPSATTSASPCFETAAWLRFKAYYRALGFKTHEECAKYLDTSERTVQRYWAKKSPIPGKVLMAFEHLGAERGVVVARPMKEAA